MPELDVSDEKVADAMGLIVVHLIEQFTELNRTLTRIADTLDAMQERLSYATVLDNQD